MLNGMKAIFAINAGSGLQSVNLTVRRSTATISLILPPYSQSGTPTEAGSKVASGVGVSAAAGACVVGAGVSVAPPPQAVKNKLANTRRDSRTFTVRFIVLLLISS